jgi:hypothetical protein
LNVLSDVEIKILVGKNQNKIPLETVQGLQKLGSCLEWIQVPGQGKNALDFFVAYFLGKYTQEKRYQAYKIVSKDTGYDPLISYLKNQRITIERLTNVKQIGGEISDKAHNPDIDLVIEKIKKINIKSRPKKRKSLIAHLETTLKNKKTKEEIIEIVEDLFTNRILTEFNGQLKYTGIEEKT